MVQITLAKEIDMMLKGVYKKPNDTSEIQSKGTLTAHWSLLMSRFESIVHRYILGNRPQGATLRPSREHKFWGANVVRASDVTSPRSQLNILGNNGEERWSNLKTRNDLGEPGESSLEWHEDKNDYA